MFNEKMKMGELIESMPGARRALFAKYHIGGCQSCAFDEMETLSDLCLRSELAPDEVLEHLLASHEHDAQMLLSPIQIQAKLLAGESLRWIDVRTREEFEAVRIPEAEFFGEDLQRTLFAEKPSDLVILYDHTGKYVLDQVAWFRGHGLNHAYGLQGGIDAWSREVDASIMRYRMEIG